MSKSNQTFLIARTLSDVFYHLKNVNELQIRGGGTGKFPFAEKVLAISSIPELSTIEKKERFIEFGSAVTLSRILDVGRTNMSPVLYDAIKTIASESVRNIATIGGNICSGSEENGTQKSTLWGPLLALGAVLEFRKKPNDSKMIPFSQFKKVPEGYLLTKVRVPQNESEVAIFKRVGPSRRITEDSASFVFLADMENDSIASIKIILAGSIVFHPVEIENQILYTKLPLTRDFIEKKVAEAESAYDIKFSGQKSKRLLKAQFLNMLRYSFEQLM